MRSETEMMTMILDFATHDPRIRAAGLNGSRVNPNVQKDILQDYDVALLVNDMDYFVSNESWLEAFGPILIMQKPEAMSVFPPSLGGWFTYLVQFKDGNRIDFCFLPVEDKERYLNNDSLTKILLDKDGLFPNPPESSDIKYHVKRPTITQYLDYCNEFYWVALYVGKGLWRNELLYANRCMENVVRPCLLKMLEWKVGFDTGFSMSLGNCYKYMPRHITTASYEKLMKTYRMDNVEHGWEALSSALDLFATVAKSVAQLLDCKYPYHEEEGALHYLRRLRSLPEHSH